MDSDEAVLRDKLRKIEALFAGAGTPGERAAAGAAAERIRAKLRDVGRRERSVETRFTVPDPWSRQLFIALCRRYGVTPFRYPRMRRQSLVIKAPRSFVDDTLWPEFTEIDSALKTYLAAVTDRVIREEVFNDPRDAEDAPAGRR